MQLFDRLVLRLIRSGAISDDRFEPVDGGLVLHRANGRGDPVRGAASDEYGGGEEDPGAAAQPRLPDGSVRGGRLVGGGKGGGVVHVVLH